MSAEQIKHRRFCRHCSDALFRDSTLAGFLCLMIGLGCVLACMAGAP
jgi:hypothetical protein